MDRKFTAARWHCPSQLRLRAPGGRVARFVNVTVTLNSWLFLGHLGGIGLSSWEGEGKQFGLEPCVACVTVVVNVRVVCVCACEYVYVCVVCVCECVSHPCSPGLPSLELIRTAGLEGGGRASAAQTFVSDRKGVGVKSAPGRSGDC